MPLPKEKYYTVDEFYNLPDDIHAELINGQIVYMATPSETVNLTVYYVIFMPPFFVSLFSFSLVIALPENIIRKGQRIMFSSRACLSTKGK